MKNILLIIFALFTALPLIAQEPTDVEGKLNPFIQQHAQPKGGMEKFRETFMERLIIPDDIPFEVKKISIKIQFVVEKDGSLSDIRVSDNDFGVGVEAIKVLKSMPKWEPAWHEGTKVRSSYTFPVAIVINDNEESYLADLSDNELSIYMQLLQSSLIETPVFEMRCYQCELLDNGKNSYIISNKDKYATYEMQLFNVDEQTSKEMAKVIVNESKNEQDVSFYETTILGEKASGLKSVEVNDKVTIHRRLEYLYINDYFVFILVFTSNEKLNDALVEHLKSTLKFKNI